MKLTKLEQMLSRATTINQLDLALNDYLTDLNITTYSFTYYSYHSYEQLKIKHEFASKKLQEWHAHFLDEKYEEVDSTLDKENRQVFPVYWTIQQQIRDAKNKREKKMRLDSLDFGTDKGLSIPLHGPGYEFANLMVEQLVGETCLENWQELKFELLAAGYCYFHFLRKKVLTTREDQNELKILGKRELQCLALVAKNFSVAEIAKQLHITERTVNYHIQRVNKRLGVKNKYQAVARATEQGILEL